MESDVVTMAQVDEACAAPELCRLSREAYDNDDHERAGRFARQAMSSAHDDEGVIDFCGWLFSSIRWHADAIAAFSFIERLKPLSAAQHAYISGVLLQRGDKEGAVRSAALAVSSEPDSGIYRRHYATVLEMCDHPMEAAMALVEAIKLNRGDALLYGHLSQVTTVLGKVSEAKAFAAKAWGLDQDNFQLGRNFAHMLMTQRDFAEAARVLTHLVARGDDQHATFLMLSIALSQDKLYDQALAAATEGLERDGDNVELLMQKGAVLCCLALYDRASEAFARVLILSPEHDAAGRGSFAALTEAGRYGEATLIGARLVSTHPDDVQTGRTLLHVLTQRFLRDGDDAIDGKTLAEIKRRNRISRSTVESSLLARGGIQLRVLGALILRELVTRFGRSKLGYTWALFEPLAHISIMVALINGFAHGSPPMGDNFAVFYFTGIIPYHLFTHTAGQLCSAIPSNRAMLQLPIVTTVDVFVSRSVLELLTESSVALILFFGFIGLGLKAVPIDVPGVIVALIQLWIVAVAVGILNAVISGFFHAWERIWGALTSILYFSSGTFYVPQIMPENIRNALAWNPILQAIELVRASYFHVPHHPWVSSSYLWSLGAVLLALSLVLERSFRRRLMAAE